MPDTLYPFWRRSVAWIDFYGKERLTALTGAPDVGTTATMEAMAACSQGMVTCHWEGAVAVTGVNPPTVSVPWFSNGYVLTLKVIDSSNNPDFIYIPSPLTELSSPKDTILNPDKWTADVDGANMAILALNFSTELNISSSGDGVTDIVDGWVSYSSTPLNRTFAITPDVPLVRRSCEFVDAAGKHFLTILTSRAGALISQGKIELVTNAALVTGWEGPVVIPEGTVIYSDPYGSVADEARLYFADAYGARTSIVIPAPKRSLFKSDGKTLDSTGNFDVISVIAAALSECWVSSTGRPFTTYLGGYYQSNRVYQS